VLVSESRIDNNTVGTYLVELLLEWTIGTAFDTCQLHRSTLLHRWSFVREGFREERREVDGALR